MQELIFFPISFIFLLISTYTDLKSRIIPNLFTYSMIGLGIILHLYFAIQQNNYWIFLIAIASTIATFAASWFLWKQGVWAGGDVKLFTGLAALNPWNIVFFPTILNYSFFLGNENLFSIFQFPLFPLTLFIFSVLSTLPYTALLSTKKIILNHNIRMEFLSKMAKRIPNTVFFSITLFGLTTILNSLGLQGILFGIILFIGMVGIGIILIRWKKIARAAGILLFLYSLSTIGIWNGILQTVNYFIGIILIELFIELYQLTKKYVLKKSIPVTELKEGDIPYFTFVEINGKIEKQEGVSIQRVLKAASENNLPKLMEILSPPGRVVIDSKPAAGLEESQVKEIKKLAEEKKIEETIEIKLSAPFAPAILLAYVVLNVIGDALWILLF